MRIGVIGAGAWGTALAKLICDNEHDVTIWAYETEVAEEIDRDRSNSVYLPGFELPPNLSATADLEEAMRGAEVVVSVCPSHVVRQVLGEAGPYIGRNVPIVSATKGIENDTLMTMSEVLEDVLPIHCHPYLAYVSGPSFAKEVAQRIPTAVVIASYSDKLGRKLQDFFATPYFRVYSSTDVLGVEMGGALKNVIAIAAGAAVGMGLGDNSRAGMVTRGVHEISRMAMYRGANPLTLMGLSGMGDLVLTCYGPLSRNRSVGEQLGKGRKLADILAETRTVAEGVKTARSVYNLAKQYGIEMPISEQVYYVLYEDKPVVQALTDLMARGLKREQAFF